MDRPHQELRSEADYRERGPSSSGIFPASPMGSTALPHRIGSLDVDAEAAELRKVLSAASSTQR
jgi:hypothetical protein